MNLLEAREYADLGRTERLARAVEEQESFLNASLAPSLRAALDLRIRVDPSAGTPLEIAVLCRTWNSEEQAAEGRAGAISRQLHASLPRHVVGSPIESPDELCGWLSPFGPQPIEIASLTRRELTATPSRPDAEVAYYFSVTPLNWTLADWTGLYGSLAALTSPAVVSVGLLPVQVSSALAGLLHRYATFYARLAREGRQPGGLYFGERALPPDAFAVEGERVFSDYARRLAEKAFVMRVQIAAPERLPPGLLESVATAIFPADEGPGSHLERERAAAAYEVRRPATGHDLQVARRNLEALDFCLPRGSRHIWGRPDPPPTELRALASLGDAKDASSAFRLPVAVDGTVPGFRVRRGHFGHAESYDGGGPRLKLGTLPGNGKPVTIVPRDLTKHALVAGSPGSGKTTTVLELLRQLWLDHRVPFLVIEPVNDLADDYRRLTGEPGFENIDVITVGDEGSRPLRFNPFAVPEGVLVAEHAANLLACFKAAFGLWEPLPGIYEEAISETYLSAGVLASERAGEQERWWPTVIEFLRAMRKVAGDLGYSGEVKANIEAASIRRAQQLTVGVCASAFRTNLTFDVAGLLSRPTVLELKALGSGDEQSLMLALILNAITEHYMASRGASPELRHVTVIEEAHRLLARAAGGKRSEEAQAKEKAAEAFANNLAENRKYGEGLVIAEQTPTKLVEDALKNTNLKVMHRLTAEDERRQVGETMGLDETQLRFATRLQTGEALVYADEFAEALHVEIEPRLTVPAPLPVEPEERPPFTHCEPCKRKCRFRGASLAIARHKRVSDRVREHMHELSQGDLAADELEAAWSRFVTTLRDEVSRFPALPATEPERSYAAYCLFLHAATTQSTRLSPGWATSVAQRLESQVAEATA